MNVNEARLALAAACNTVPLVAVRPRPIRSPIAGDGWVIVTRAQPYTFNTLAVDFTVVIVLGAESETSEANLDKWLLPIMDAISQGVLCSNVLAEGSAITVAQAPVNVLTITATMEVE